MSLQSTSGNQNIDNDTERKIEIESMNDDDTKVIDVASISNVPIVKSNKKLIKRSVNCSKLRVKTLPKRNWNISHNRMFLTKIKNKNGFKNRNRKNVKVQCKRIAKIISKQSSIDIKIIDDNKQLCDDNSRELSASGNDSSSCKETFLDKLELHKHKKIINPDISIKFCHVCNDTFFDDNELKNHTLTIHGECHNVTDEHDNDLDQLNKNIINELERIDENCSNENVSDITQTTNQSINECENELNIDDDKIPTETLDFIEDTTIESSENYTYAVKVEIANRESDILSYTALEEKKEYCSNDYDDCDDVNDTTIKKCEWIDDSKQDNYTDNNTQESMLINNEISIDNCLTSSMEEFQDIEELETSCEVDYTEKVDEIDEIIETSNSSTVKDNIELISDIADDSAIESIELLDNEHNNESTIQLIEISNSDINPMPSSSSSSLNSSSSICKTYSSKINSNILKKSTIKINNIKKDDIPFCIMCREIFSLIEQKSVKVNSTTESIFKCPLCSRQFSSRSTLEKHVAYHHLNCECTKIVKSSSSSLPSLLSSSSSSISLETSLSSSSKLYECVLCLTVFNDYNELNNHILSLHEPMPPFKDRLTIGKPEYLRTIRCSYMEPKMSMAKNKNTTVNLSNINCPNCDMTFFTCDDYILHVKEIHNSMTPIDNNTWQSSHVNTTQINHNAISTDVTTIDINDEIIQLNNSDINDTIVTMDNVVDDCDTGINYNEYHNACKHCDKKFDRIRDLKEHIYLSHNNTLNSETITILTSTNDKYNREWHCLNCSQKFKILQNYIRHRYFIHNDESMIHICDNCKKILTSITMVNVHVCLNAKSWICKPCNQSFNNAVELRLHNTAEHMETIGPHICTICEKKFLTNTMLMRHCETKKCYPRVRPPEKLNIKNSIIIKNWMKHDTNIVTKGKILTGGKKLKKDYSRMQNSSRMRVIQEDIFTRGVKNKNKIGNKHFNSPLSSPESQKNDEIYQCSMCKLYFLSKAGLKIHLNRAHTSAVEICQLCYKMFVSGNLVRHITDNHIKHDNNNQSYYKALRVKLHNTFHINEHDIEKDTEELIDAIGTNQLLGLCEYQRFTEQSDNTDIYCPDCSLTFSNSEIYRRHYVQSHDKLCALCDMEFETGQDAARHKTRSHGSIACYVWFAHKLIAAISDTKTFSEVAEKIIIDTMPNDKNDINTMEIDENNDNNIYINDTEIKDDEINNTNDKLLQLANSIQWDDNNTVNDNSLHDESTTFININNIKNEIDIMPITIVTDDVHSSVDDNNSNNHKDDNINDNLDDYKLFILVTEDDLEKYKDNITELARQIYSTCNLFSIDQIETMLEPYVRK